MTIRLLFAALLLVPVVSASQDTAESSLRLYVLDGGTLTNPDPSWAGVTVEDVKGFTSLPSPAFLIVHPSGTLLWDAGLGDHLLGRPLDENRRGPWGQVVTRSLRGQLEEVGYLPVDIDYLALSHLHFDHIGSASDYAASTWIVQQAEREASVPARDPLTERVYRRANEGETIALNGDHDVFGDGAVVIKSTPGHTAGHQSLFVDLPVTGGVLISGDLWHYAVERELDKMPAREVGPGVTATSRESIETFLRETGAELWVQHEPMEWATLERSPSYYE